MSAISDGLTLARNFGPWFGGVALAAALAGGGAAWWLAGLYHGERVRNAQRAQERAEATLAAYKSEMHTAVAEGEAAGAKRVAEALDAERERAARISTAVAGIPAEVARLLAPDMEILRSTLDDPRFRCLDMPLPEPALDILRRPGGRAGSADDHRSTESGGSS